MNNKLFILFFFFGLLLSGKVMAQDVVVERSSQITKIGSKEYYMHKVKAGHTLYSISKVYNVSIEEIEALNPEVKEGLKVGHVLGIPVRPVVEPKKEEPQPVTVEPEPETVPEPEPVAVEPEPEPEPVVNEPEAEPEPEPIVVEPELVIEQPQVEETVNANPKAFFDGRARIVQHGEDLYDIAKEYGIDVADLKNANPRLTFEEPHEGSRIVIPNIAN